AVRSEKQKTAVGKRPPRSDVGSVRRDFQAPLPVNDPLGYLPAPDTPPLSTKIVFHDRPFFPRGSRGGSRNCGLKPTAKDLALFVSDVDAAAAAVFTRNQFPGAPVLLGRETIRDGRLGGVSPNRKVTS